MKHIGYKKGDTVILMISQVAEVAVISRAYNYRNQPVYDAVTERGSYFTRLTTDSEKHLIYIDIKATNKFTNKIKPTVSETLIIEKIIGYEIINGDSGIAGNDDDINFDSSNI